MPVKTKRTAKGKGAKKVKKPAVRATAKKARKAKKPAARKTAKKAGAKKFSAKKTVKKHEQDKRKPAKTSSKKAANKRVAKTSIKKTSIKKTAWRISPEISQSVVDIDIWKKGDLRIEHLTIYRTGWIVVHQLPDLSGYNPDEGINIFEEFEFDEHQLHEGTKEASVFPNELPAEERARLHALSEAELEDEGWTLESVTRFKGPLVVEEVEVLAST